MNEKILNRKEYRANFNIFFGSSEKILISIQFIFATGILSSLQIHHSEILITSKYIIFFHLHELTSAEKQKIRKTQILFMKYLIVHIFAV